MTPDKPYNIIVCLVGSILCWVLPVRYALVPLAVALCCWPSTLLLPPEKMGLTPQRVIGFVLLLRCLTTPAIRRGFKWSGVDTAALAYIALLTISQAITKGPAQAINNRGGFFLSALVPFWCVRFLLTDKERLYALLKGWIWAAVPIAGVGVYQHYTGQHPLFQFMPYGVPPINPMLSQRPVDMRKLFGVMRYRAQLPFLQSIMFGWFFALMLSWGTCLFWEKRKLFPWIIPWAIALPVGILASIAGGPMMLAALSMGMLGLFPFRKYWKPAVWCLGVALVVLGIVVKRSPLELLANVGFDASSSWYRVGLQKYTLSGGGMSGHWIAGYGDVPGEYHHFHDLCIHWIYLCVTNGLMGAVGFYTLMFMCVLRLWQAKARAAGVDDQWILWSMMAGWIGSIMAMFVVTVFGEMYYIYHMFLGAMANAPIIMGGGSRHVGVVAHVDGRPVILRYELKRGQHLAIVRPGQ